MSWRRSACIDAFNGSPNARQQISIADGFQVANKTGAEFNSHAPPRRTAKTSSRANVPALIALLNGANKRCVFERSLQSIPDQDQAAPVRLQ